MLALLIYKALMNATEQVTVTVSRSTTNTSLVVFEQEPELEIAECAASDVV
jgi:hypothetical protein